MIFFIVSSVASAQVYVKKRPVAPVKQKTEILSKGYTFVDEDWESYDGNYRYAGNRWVGNRKGYIWKKGHWKMHRRYGETWIKGKWK